MSSSKVSFTVRRPSPVSRTVSSSDEATSFRLPAIPKHLSNNGPTPLGSPLARSATSSPRPPPETPREAYDSSDDEGEGQDELVTGFDKFGVQRAFEKKKVEGPLVIAPLRNKDWREVARKRRGGTTYVPESAKAQTGADGSVGGLGTRETINSGPVLSGLQVKAKREVVDGIEEDVLMEDEVKEEVVEETEEQRALRALLAEASGEQPGDVFVPTIPAISETDALKQDVDELPEVATLDDYERVPVSQFGAAMLRGMGWKEGQAASRKGKGMVEPYIPASRPALLGIGAKEQEVYDDGSKSSKYKNRKPERRYVPVLKQERETSERSDSRKRSRSPERSAAQSRRTSRSPARDERSRYDREGESSRRRDRDDAYGRSRDYDRERERDRDRDYQRKDSDRDRDRRRDYDRRDSGRRRDY
ncbi:DExH-box splicing factor binding site-domain-containing protein [Coprinopsis sp. MPI-PUGE-AT-0042]|nr:DExH-box splicing factor binding site-domain-containing protein [Coprinopsis sp. MPI-PUGE-AT-0042]